MGLEPKTEAEPSTDPLQHYLKCAFLQAIILASEARREKGCAKKVYIYMGIIFLHFAPNINII